MLFVCHAKILDKHCLQFLLVVKIAPIETENNGYAKFWIDKQRALWYVVVFSGVVNWTHGAISMTSMFAARNTLRDRRQRNQLHLS